MAASERMGNFKVHTFEHLLVLNCFVVRDWEMTREWRQVRVGHLIHGKFKKNQNDQIYKEKVSSHKGRAL